MACMQAAETCQICCWKASCRHAPCITVHLLFDTGQRTDFEHMPADQACFTHSFASQVTSDPQPLHVCTPSMHGADAAVKVCKQRLEPFSVAVSMCDAAHP